MLLPRLKGRQGVRGKNVLNASQDTSPGNPAHPLRNQGLTPL